MGTHEFVDFCRQVGAEPYFAANMTSDPFGVKYWGVGSEIFGQAEFALLAADDVHAHNSFDNPECVKPIRRAGGIHDGDAVKIPAGGILAVTVKA